MSEQEKKHEKDKKKRIEQERKEQKEREKREQEVRKRFKVHFSLLMACEKVLKPL